MRVGAADDHLLLVLVHSGAAHGTVGGCGDGGFIATAQLLLHGDDGGNDLAGFFNDDDIAHTDVLAFDLLVVVQRGIADGAPADEHGHQPRHGRESASAAHLDVDGQQLGLRLLGLVFVGNGPARGLAGDAELALISKAVHLDHRAIGFIR